MIIAKLKQVMLLLFKKSLRNCESRNIVKVFVNLFKEQIHEILGKRLSDKSRFLKLLETRSRKKKKNWKSKGNKRGKTETIFSESKIQRFFYIIGIKVKSKSNDSNEMILSLKIK